MSGRRSRNAVLLRARAISAPDQSPSGIHAWRAMPARRPPCTIVPARHTAHADSVVRSATSRYTMVATMLTEGAVLNLPSDWLLQPADSAAMDRAWSERAFKIDGRMRSPRLGRVQRGRRAPSGGRGGTPQIRCPSIL